VGVITLPLGSARVEVHVDTDPMEPELEEGLRRAERDAGPLLDSIGDSWGERLADSVSGELGQHGDDFAHSIGDSLEGRKVHARPSFDFDDDVDFDDSFFRRVEERIERAFDQTGDRLGRPGGPINRIGRGIQDAIGAGFNVSGRSSLLVFLIPLIGVIVALILGAVQAVGALIATLVTIPALIAAIGLQVGVLKLAWEGVGTAITGAFAAKNAKELNEALKGLTPSAQKFVRSLLPLRDLFRDLKALTQESFFKAVGTSVGKLFEVLGPVLRAGLPALASALGGLFADLTAFFGSPTFIKFIEDVIPATIQWLDRFGPAFITFLDGLIAMSDAALPFLKALGDMLAGNLENLGRIFSDAAKDPDFQKWLTSMRDTLKDTFELLGQLIQFLAAFMTSLDEAGGAEIIREFSEALERLSFFLASPAGFEAMRGLVNFSILMIDVFAGLILAILLITASLQAFFHFVNDELVPGIGEGFGKLGEKISNFFESLGRILGGGRVIWNSFIVSLRQGADNAEVFLRAIPGRIKAAIASLPALAYEAGKNFIQSLINGITVMYGPLGQAMRVAAAILTSYLPGSPAEKGPLSGSGYALYRGQHLVRDLARGIAMEAPELRMASLEATSNIIFNRDSIRVGFEGTLPTQEQARVTGAAVGTGITKQLAIRSTRLAVRML